MIMYTTAKHYLEVVCTHLEALRSVNISFSVVIQAQAGPAGSEPPEASRAAAEQSLSEDFEDFIISERGFGRFYKNLQDPQRIL